MSKHASPTAAAGESVTLEIGLEALESSSEFHGPVEDLDGHHCNDHFAQIYETDAERFAAAVPFVRHGIEQDERVMYVIDKSSEAEVETALRNGGIDVDAAVATGQLSFHTVQDTYLRNGTFEPDQMIGFYSDTVTEATAEYEALRIVAETTWLQDDATTVEQFMEYEAKVNELFAETDSLALCQYDRDGFSPEIIRNIIQTHPHLIYDGAACHNFYYTPPTEFFSADEPARENDRMLRMLHERTTAKAELRERERFLQEFSEVTADQSQSFDAKIRRLLELGTERFDLEIGYFTRTHDNDTFTVVDAIGPTEQIEPGVTDSLCETYCEKLLASPGPIAVRNAADVGWTNDPAYETYGLDAYFATTVHVGGEEYGTLCFASKTPRDHPYTDAERAFLDLMCQWMGDQLERRRRERYLRESLRTTAAPDLGFEEKLEELLDLGREWMGLDAAGLTHLPEWDGKFLTKYAIGYGDGNGDEVVDESDDLWTDPGEGCFCRQVMTEDEPIGKADVRGTDWENDSIHQEQGLTSYLGTKVTIDSTPYGTLWVGSTEPRDRGFSENERTFLKLVGQWVSYELERNQREEQLQQKTDRLESFASMLAHELRNPVAIGQIYSQQLPAEVDAEAVDYITEAFDRIEDMVDVMLVLTRGREAIGEQAPVDLGAEAREAWTDVDAPDATLNIEMDLTIQADETYIRHLFRNLLENAVEHGGTDVTVTVGELEDGFYVADDGDGIPTEEREAVFDEGYTTAAANGGTGLGLAFVQKLTEVYEWDYTVTESADGGARFEFYNV